MVKEGNTAYNIKNMHKVIFLEIKLRITIQCEQKAWKVGLWDNLFVNTRELHYFFAFILLS